MTDNHHSDKAEPRGWYVLLVVALLSQMALYYLLMKMYA